MEHAITDTGFRCLACDLPFAVDTVRRPARGIAVRYRSCPRCRRKLITEERVVLRGDQVVTQERVSASRRPRCPAAVSDGRSTDG